MIGIGHTNAHYHHCCPQYPSTVALQSSIYCEPKHLHSLILKYLVSASTTYFQVLSRLPLGLTVSAS